jgi:hypothetical protein
VVYSALLGVMPDMDAPRDGRRRQRHRPPPARIVAGSTSGGYVLRKIRAHRRSAGPRPHCLTAVPRHALF